jgi:hypothetical protein
MEQVFRSSDSPILSLDLLCPIVMYLNSFPVMAPLTAPLIGVHFLKGCISLKNWTKTVLLIMCTSPFKGTCHFIYSVEDPLGLYVASVLRYKPVRTHLWKSDFKIGETRKTLRARLIFPQCWSMCHPHD